MLFSNWSSRISLNSFNGHYMISCYSVTGHQGCRWTQSIVFIWCHAIQLLVIKIAIELIQWSIFDVMLFSNWSSRLSLNSFDGHYMMSCYSVTGHQDYHWTHSMVIIWCHAIQLLAIKIVIELIQWSFCDVMLFSNWSSRLSLNSFNGRYMMSCYSVTGYQDCHWTHSMVILWYHAIQ